MCDDHHGDPQVTVEIPKGLHEVELGDQVERGRRFIQDEHLRIEQQAHRDDRPLLHPS